jgi:hypothetical protein
VEVRGPDERTVILKPDGTWEYKKEAPVPAPTATPTSGTTPETLSPNFSGDEVTTLLHQLVDLRKRLVKSEFETSAAYEARVAEEKKKPLIGSRTAEDSFYLVSSAKPLLDALLALLDRLLDQPYSSAALAMVEVLVESNRFHNSSIFELMRPEVLKTIFEIIKQTDDYGFYDYRDAALGVRPSPAALEEVRSHLKDENARVRQVAAELAGAHQDNVAVDELIQLLRDPDDDVQDRTFRAFGHMGEPAVLPLLNFIDDKSQALELRSSCITALRNVGLRPARVSTTLEQTLKQAKTSPELLESSLLTAAGLRDRGHSASAKNALRSEDEPVVLAAAKYLAEVPEPGAFSALRQLLKPQPVDAARPYRRAWVIIRR